MYTTIDYGDFEYPINHEDALDFASELMADTYGINRSAARNIINEFDLLDGIITDKKEEYREYFRDDAEEWNKQLTLAEIEYEEFLAANRERRAV